jgi:hydroxyethylthiazole kinase-like uncharacterized protein yjeF
MSEPILTVRDIRRVETAAFAQTPPPPLMERAGLATAEIARDLLGEGARVLVLAGPGNNGGDAFVVARHLRSWWFDVDVLFAGDAAKLPPDAAAALSSWRDSGGTCVADWPDGPHHDLVIDGLFGIGLQRPLEGAMAALVDRANACGSRILALDVPSGLDADTGRVLGTAIRADDTVTFIALKPGLLTLDGPDHAGEPSTSPTSGSIVRSSTHRRAAGCSRRPTSRTVLPPRPKNSHKGTHGDLWILGGAAGMAGAALLSARAGLLGGAGRVLVAMPDGALALDPLQPELMLRPGCTPDAWTDAACLVVGPGLGQSGTSARWVDAALALPVPLVLDADALNLIANSPDRQRLVAGREAPTVLTPHPAEAGRLLGAGTASVQSDRLAAALALAAQFRADVVLKGVGSVCAAPDGRWWINGSGNPGLAAGGHGRCPRRDHRRADRAGRGRRCGTPGGRSPARTGRRSARRIRRRPGRDDGVRGRARGAGRVQRDPPGPLIATRGVARPVPRPGIS